MFMTVKTRNQPDFQTELTNAFPEDIEFFEASQIELEMRVRSSSVTYVALIGDSSTDGEPLSTSVQAEENVSLHETMSTLRSQCEQLTSEWAND